MSDALEKRRDTAISARPEAETPAPISAIALSNQSYWQRARQIVVWQTGEYLKNDFWYSSVAALVMGFIAFLLERHIDVTAVYFAILGFCVMFAARFGQHVVVTPKLIDSATRNALNTSEQRNAELTKHKLIFEVRQRGCRVFVKDQAADPPMIIVKVELRFENRDTSQWTVRGLDIALCRIGEKDIFAYTNTAYSSEGREVDAETFETMLVPAGVTTRLYLFDAVLGVRDERIKSPSDLDVVHFLRVTLRSNAIQSPVEGKFHVSWESALEDKGAMPHLIRDVPVISMFEGIAGL